MQRRGPCVHQQHLEASASASATPQAPARGRSIAAAACLRLYAEGRAFLEHKELLYSKFGLEKVPDRKSTMPSRDLSQSMKPEPAPAPKVAKPTNLQPGTAKAGANQAYRTAGPTKRASAECSGLKTGLGSPGRRSTTVYGGGRSPTATTMKQGAAQTYSLQSTMASRAAVTPRHKSNTTTSKRPPSPKGAPAKKAPSPKRSASRSKDTAKPSRINPVKTSTMGRGGPTLSQNQQSASQMRRSSTVGTLELPGERATRASMVSPRSGAMVGRRTSTASSQQSSYSTIFQQQQQQRQEPVLVQVSRRTSSPIIAPGDVGGRRRPSVAPIGPALSPSRRESRGGFDMANAVSLSETGPRTSFIRRDNKMEKLQEQVNVLKASLGISDEDLLWKVESTKGNAFLAADKHLAACEERYDRLVFEMQVLSEPTRCVNEDKANVALAAKLRSLERQAQQVAELKARATTYQSDMNQAKKDLLAARVEAELKKAKQEAGAGYNVEQTAARRLESIKEELLAVQQQLKPQQAELQTLLEWLATETDRFASSVAVEDLSPSPVFSDETLESKRTLLYALRTIPECTQGSERLSTLCSQATQLATKITVSRANDLKRTEADLERTMRDVEIWKTRREQAKEFGDEMRKREAAWQAQQRPANDECLSLMRTFIPIDIADLSIDALIARANEGPSGPGSGTLYTYDLAAYLKTNRFLHWIVTHEDDIARANFLSVESASFFMDFATYDIHELRALARVLPESFAFDKDCRKNAWRSSFIDYVRMLASQQQRETIKAGWDPVKRARRAVHLPELTARQQLNPIFCYPTDAEIDARLKKFDLQRTRLETKRTRLRLLEDELIPQAKAEYLAVADDVRNEDLQRSFGKPTLIALRDEAKQQHLVFCKERDSVKGDLAHGERAWAAMTPSFEQYQAEVAQIRALNPEIRNAARMRGPFPADIDVQPRERAAFKKLSVEEEAEVRKQELDSAIAKRGQDIVAEESQTVADVPVAPIVGRLAISGFTETEEEATRLMQLEDKQLTELNAPSDLPATPSRGFRRVKSLQVAVGVLQFLEKDFCSPKRVTQSKEGSLVRIASAPASEDVAESPKKSDEAELKTPRSSRSMPLTPRTNSRNSAKEVVVITKEVKPPPVVVPPKSKALLKLLEARKAEEANANSPNVTDRVDTPRPSPFGGGKVNFLGELQNRLRKNSNAEADGNKDAEPTVKQPMNFLDELKNASARKSGNTEDSSNVVDISSPQIAKPLAAKSGSPAPRNFLDELKSRTSSS